MGDALVQLELAEVAVIELCSKRLMELDHERLSTADVTDGDRELPFLSFQGKHIERIGPVAAWQLVLLTSLRKHERASRG